MKRVGLAVLILVALCVSAFGADKEEEKFHPYPLWPSDRVPGRPGLGAPEIWPHYQDWKQARQAGNEEQAAEIIEPFKSQHFLHGHPEFLCYPGAVEHVRCVWQRYVPPYPMYNENTLVKNVILAERDDLKADCVEFAEPVYWYSQWNTRFSTSKRRPAVKAYPWEPGESIELTVGPLKPKMMYAVRIVAALKSEDVMRYPTVVREEPKGGPAKQLVFKFEINDKPDGSTSTYYLRGRTWDQFYHTASCLWHVVDDRTFNIRITYMPESEATLLTHNIDVHNVFGETAMRTGKKEPVTYDSAARAEKWSTNREELPTMNRRKHGTLLREAADYQGRLRGTRIENAEQLLAAMKKPAMDAEGRAERDDVLWHSLPPMNVMIDRRTASRAEAVRAGWGPVNRYMRNWDSRFFLVREKDGKREKYTWEDMAAHKKLPGTEDRGYGVKLDEPVEHRGKRQVLSYIGLMNIERWRAQGRKVRELTHLYHRLGDRDAARDAAFLLARMAYHYPALRGINYLTWAELKNPIWRGDDGRGGRYAPAHWGEISLRDFMVYYDRLYPYIKGNEELAQALGRYIPWVESPEDVRFLFEVYVVQYGVRDYTHFRRVTGHGIPKSILRAAAIQNDREISKPWMEFAFSRSWEYPQALAGIDDNTVTSLTRDGVQNIGSWSYAGAVGLSAAEMTSTYVEHGGYPQYNLGDYQEYPKSLAGVYFFIESMVAGGHYPGIGDVGGPSRPLYYHVRRKLDELVRPGWQETHDPRFAWLLVNWFERGAESDEEWAEIQQAAEAMQNPYWTQRSRVLSDWMGVLESGVGHPDFRFHQAAAVNVGNGIGHHHHDTLDLRLWSLGCHMSGDFGQRQSYGRPRHNATYSHNVVEVDGDGAFWTRNSGEWDGYAWVPNLFDAPGASYLMAQSTPPPRHQNVDLFRRQVSLVNVSPGEPSDEENPQQDAGVTLPRTYVFEVFRVSGGKRHTYCFHGCPDDNHLEDGGFVVNARNREILDSVDATAIEEGTASAEEMYMRRFRWARVCERYTGKPPKDMDKQWAADPADDIVQATWRLARGSENKNYGNGDIGALTEERKFTRLHLFDVGDHRLLHGINTDTNGSNRLNPDVPHYAGRCLYVQQNSPTEMDSVYTALIEPYAGEPFIASRRLLDIPGNETDARRAVAVEVKTTNGHTDLLFADGRPEKERTLPGDVRVSGEYAFLSRDDAGLRQATLTGGTRLSTPDIDIRIETPAYEGQVVSVDLVERTAVVDGLPADPPLAGQFFEIGNEEHRSTFEIDRIAPAADGAQALHCRKGLEIMRGTIMDADYENNQLVTNIAMLHYPGRDDGLVATNQQDLSKRWRVRYEGGSRFDGHTFTLKGDPITAEDFPVGGKLSVWEFGAGDTVTLRTGVSLQRVAEGRYEVYANAPFAVTLEAEGIEFSRTGERWRPVETEPREGRLTAHVDAEQIGSGRFLLRVK